MIVDYVLPKPPSAGGYSLHRIVEGLTGGARPLFADMGDRLLVRSAVPINGVETLPVQNCRRYGGIPVARLGRKNARQQLLPDG